MSENKPVFTKKIEWFFLSDLARSILLLIFIINKNKIFRYDINIFIKYFNKDLEEIKKALRELVDAGFFRLLEKNKKYYLQLVLDDSFIPDSFKLIDGLSCFFGKPCFFFGYTKEDIQDGDHIRVIFDYWVRRTGRDPVRTKLIPERKTVIKKMLRYYSKDQIFQAINGMMMSDWHIGNNPGGRQYTDLKIVYKNLELFLELVND